MPDEQAPEEVSPAPPPLESDSTTTPPVALRQFLVRHWIALLFVGLVYAVTAYVLYELKHNWATPAPMPELIAPKPGEAENPDASVMISTFIIIYTSFVAAYAALTTELIKGSRVGSLWLAALLLILGAVGVDLWRIWNSSGDLLATTMRMLIPTGAEDAEIDFKGYLIVNVAVLLFTLFVICLRRPNHADAH